MKGARVTLNSTFQTVEIKAQTMVMLIDIQWDSPVFIMSSSSVSLRIDTEYCASIAPTEGSECGKKILFLNEDPRTAVAAEERGVGGTGWGLTCGTRLALTEIQDPRSS